MQSTWQSLRAIDLKYLLRGLLSVGTNHTAGILIALASSVFFANYVEKDIYGNYQFFLTILATLSIFTLRGVGKQIILAHVKHQKDILLAKTIQFFLYALPVALLGLAAPVYFYLHDNTPMTIALLVGVLSFPIIGALGLYGTVYNAREKFSKLAFLGTLQNLLPALALIGTILWHPSLVALATTYCLAQVCTLTLLYAYTVYSEKLTLQTATTYASDEVHLSITDSILDLGKLADRLIVFSSLGTVSLAVYMIALMPVREMLRFPQLIKLLILPKFSGHSLKQVRSTVLNKTILLFIFLATLAGLYIVIAPFVFTLLFPAYAESVLYTQLIALVIPFSANIFMNEMFRIFEQTKALYFTNTLFSIFTVASLLILTPLFGLTGVVVSKLLATIIRFVLMLFYTYTIKIK